LCGESREVCIVHLVIVSQLKVGLCDDLSEERVERDLALCELINEDVRFFVNPNLRIKISRLVCFSYLHSLQLLFTFLLSLAHGRFSLHSYSVVVLILF
jgi:hypothetical protein